MELFVTIFVLVFAIFVSGFGFWSLILLISKIFGKDDLLQKFIDRLINEDPEKNPYYWVVKYQKLFMTTGIIITLVFLNEYWIKVISYFDFYRYQ